MGKLAVQKYFSFMILIITALMMIFTFVGLFGGNVNPVGNTARSLLVYALPVLIIGNAVLLLYWLIMRRWHWALMPFITLLCCIPYIGTLYQFGELDEAVEKEPGLKIASYNVALFGREASGFMAQDILSEMKKQKVDICCFQEYSDQSGDKRNSDSYKEYFPYSVMNYDMVVYSRYPIVRSKNIPFEMTNNSAMWVEVKVQDKVIRVYNVHLETTGINSTLHHAAKAQVNTGMEVESNRLLRALYGNYTIGMMARAGQANVLAMDMREAEVPIIVCGDFNDVPYSYVYNTMLGDKVDGFKECGSGFMYTYRGGNKKKVRIDYIFHDKVFKGMTFYKKELTYSDHYPVFMKLDINKPKTEEE